jgi:hypothetical protein
MKGIKNSHVNKFILKKKGFVENIQEMNKVLRRDQNKVIADLAEQLKKGNLEDELDSIMFEKYKSKYLFLSEDLTNEQILKNPNASKEILDIINDLINEKLKVEMMNFYSTKNSISEQNLILKNIFESIEKKINEKSKEKYLDFDVNSLSKINFLIFR